MQDSEYRDERQDQGRSNVYPVKEKRGGGEKQLSSPHICEISSHPIDRETVTQHNYIQPYQNDKARTKERKKQTERKNTPLKLGAWLLRWLARPAPSQQLARSLGSINSKF